MHRELALIFLPALSWLLFSLGGWRWKGWRRLVLPFVFCLFCLLYKMEILKICGVLSISIFIFSLGYGETKSYWYKFLVGCGYGLISLPLGLSFWNFFIPFVFITLFWLSNHKPFANIFVWKIVEGFTGCLIGISLSIQLSIQ